MENTNGKNTIVVRANEDFIGSMKGFLSSCGLAGFCAYEAVDVQSCDVLKENRVLRSFSFPVRLGVMLDYLSDIVLQSSQMQLSPVIFIGTAHLDPEHSLFSAPYLKREAVRLTEKEVAILLHLHRAGGEVVSRKDLLSAVWEYAETVETHTLETHIYRLRQKIEKDPSRPEIILTEETGYRIGF